VIDIEETIASNLFACRAGMMPSQSWFMNSHFAFMRSQSAWAISMLKPCMLPAASIDSKGGYVASTPMRIVLQSLFWASADPATRAIRAAAAAKRLRLNILDSLPSLGS
jgi:hypothetical protein